MGKYRKKPVVIEAVQWTGPHGEFDYLWLINGGAAFHMIRESSALVIKTLEGDMRADVGDWIIRGVKGEFYPCKPDIFAATYEAVEP